MILTLQILLWSFINQSVWQNADTSFNLLRVIGLIALLTISLISFVIIERLAQLSVQRNRANTLENELAQQIEIEHIVRSYAQRLEIQLQINQAILEEQSPKDIAKAAITHLRQIASCQQASLVLFDFPTGIGKVLASSADGQSVYSDGATILMEQIRVSEYLSGREIYVVEDIQALNFKSKTDQSLLDMGIRAYATTPLKVSGEFIGMIALDRKEPGPFSKEHLDIASEAATSIAVAIEQARLLDRERQQADELLRSNELLQALSNISMCIEAAPGPDSFTEALGGELSTLEISCLIATYPPETNKLEIQYASFLPDTMKRIEKLLNFPKGQWVIPAEQFSYFDELIQNKKPHFLNDVLPLADAILKSLPDRISQPILRLTDIVPDAAGIVLPLTIEDQGLGVIALWGQQLSKSDIPTFSIFANQVAIAIANAQLFETEAKRRTEAETLQRALQELTLDLDRDWVLNNIFSNLEAVIPFDSATVFLLQENMLQAVAARGFPKDTQITGKTYHPERDTIFQKLRETQQPIYLEDIQSVPEFQGWGNTGNVESWLGLPLIVRGDVIGILTIDSNAPDAYNTHDLTLAQAFANHASIALENARLFTEARGRADQLNALYRTLHEISRELELPKLLRAILQRAVELSNATSGELGLLEENSDHILIVASHNMGFDTTDRVMARKEGIMGKVAQTCEPLIIENYTQWAERSRQYTYGSWRAVMAAPMMVANKLVGVIGIVSEDSERQFDTTDLYLLNLFAQQAAVAVQNARLFGEVQRLAITDDLTGIANRRQLFTLGEREFSRAKRFNRPLSTIMLDIDHFKQINDQYGHQAGDEVLRSMAQECLTAVRDIDIVARYGGEEFTVILPETKQPAAVQIAERLRKCIECHTLGTNKGPLKITISLGVATRTETTKSLQELLAQADEALYYAKNTGRNCVAASQSSPN